MRHLRQKVLDWALRAAAEERKLHFETWRVRVGAALIVVSFVIGWGGCPLLVVAGALLGQAKMASAAAASVYCASWGTFLVGAGLVGKENSGALRPLIARVLLRRLRPSAPPLPPLRVDDL